jgi:hypothetical protein
MQAGIVDEPISEPIERERDAPVLAPTQPKIDGCQATIVDSQKIACAGAIRWTPARSDGSTCLSTS